MDVIWKTAVIDCSRICARPLLLRLFPETLFKMDIIVVQWRACRGGSLRLPRGTVLRRVSRRRMTVWRTPFFFWVPITYFSVPSVCLPSAHRRSFFSLSTTLACYTAGINPVNSGCNAGQTTPTRHPSSEISPKLIFSLPSSECTFSQPFNLGSIC